MLDEFKGKVLGGFSDYLYRGFETVGLKICYLLVWVILNKIVVK